MQPYQDRPIPEDKNMEAIDANIMDASTKHMQIISI